jgi:repressor LexA
VDELREELGLKSLKYPNDIIKLLDRKGFIRLPETGKRRKSRQIELVDSPVIPAKDDSTPAEHDPTQYLPVMGPVAAGVPVSDETGSIHWEEIARDWAEMPREVIGHNERSRLFMMDIEGDSMIGDGVVNGDRVVVLRQNIGNEGDLVVAQFLNDTTENLEVTVKRYTYRDGHPWLMPANPEYDPIDAEKAIVVGRVIALLRYPI